MEFCVYTVGHRYSDILDAECIEAVNETQAFEEFAANHGLVYISIPYELHQGLDIETSSWKPPEDDLSIVFDSEKAHMADILGDIQTQYGAEIKGWWFIEARPDEGCKVCNKMMGQLKEMNYIPEIEYHDWDAAQSKAASPGEIWWREPKVL